jgi:hypothetical protein
MPQFDPRPHFARRGVKRLPLVAGGAAEATAGDPKRSTSSELLPQLPDTRTFIVGAECLRVNGGTVSLGIPLCEWCLIGRIRPEDVGGELFLNSLTCTLGPTDYKGDGGDSVTPNRLAIPWGDKMGRGAVLVVAERLPLPDHDPGGNVWSFLPFPYPGMGDLQVNGYVFAGGRTASVADYLHEFPPGALSDAAPFKWSSPKNWGAFGRRIASGSSLDVAVVFRPGVLNQNSQDNIGNGIVALPDEDASQRLLCMHAVVQLSCGVQIGRTFNE